MANLNKLKKYHFIYKTMNLLNNEFYVGMHSTNNLNDGYLGSGKRLRRSVNKYGKENFRLEVLEFFESRELLVEKEKQLVNEELLKDPNCMNLKLGGQGGLHFMTPEESKIWHSMGGKKAYQLHKKKRSIDMSIRNKQLWESGKFNLHFNNTYWVGKTHNEKTKQKMSESKKGTCLGKNNSQFGTMWITNGTENKKIKKEELIPTGWKIGRLL